MTDLLYTDVEESLRSSVRSTLQRALDEPPGPAEPAEHVLDVLLGLVDVLGGVAVGTLALVLAAWTTGHPLRRRDRPWSLREARAPAEEQVSG